MTSADGRVALLEEKGHALLPALLPFDLLDATARSLDHWLGQAAGSRNLLAQPRCSEMAVQLKTRLVGMGLLDASSVAVQCTLFDKTADRNWLVALHQDTSIPASGAGMPAVLKEGRAVCAAAGRRADRCSPCGCIWMIAAWMRGRCASYRAATAPDG